MQRREKILLAILVAAILLWQGGRFVSRVFFAPIDDRRAELDALDAAIGAREVEQVRLARAEKLLGDARARSLPPDPLIAQRLYQGWLTDLAQNAGFAELKVAPERRVSRNEAFTTVEVSVAGEATLEQLCLFLYRFYRTDLLHRVTSMNVVGKEHEGNPPLKVSLTAEGVALSDAPTRKRLFAQTTLAKPISIADEVLTVTDPLELPAARDYLVRVGGEFLTVTGFVDKQWTVQRGAEASEWTAHESGEVVELLPVNPDAQALALAAFRSLMARNPFAVPVPVEEQPAEPAVVAEQDDRPPLDPAEFTFLIGTMSHGDDHKALLFDRLNNVRLVVAEGQPFSIAGVEGLAIRVGSDHLLFRQGEQTWRLDVGENLRALQAVTKEQQE